MIWPFKKKPAPIQDWRDWNEDWRVGDIAECINDNWHDCVKPWCRPKIGQRLTVCGFSEGVNISANVRAYFLHFSDWPVALSTCAFRKVLPVKEAEETSIGEKILKSKPAPDIKRPRPAKVKQ